DYFCCSYTTSSTLLF
nr:immunoglobulin light chain junction region [Macaca mulatta]MOW17820.1 immunoglobulin light chain junction region [Macaca mulatta]MOW18689.1 immunoglobulin light chain junction region [Macaca mulatta]